MRREWRAFEGEKLRGLTSPSATVNLELGLGFTGGHSRPSLPIVFPLVGALVGIQETRDLHATLSCKKTQQDPSKAAGCAAAQKQNRGARSLSSGSRCGRGTRFPSVEEQVGANHPSDALDATRRGSCFQN